MDAFATHADLAKKLNRTFSEPEKLWITELLEDASTYLREDVIGSQVFPQATATFTAWPSLREVPLPAQPVIGVMSVTAGTTPVQYEERDGTLRVDTDEKVTVTFTYGYATAPEGLKRWACVLVSQALIPAELKLGLSVGGLSSIALDDFKVAFADGGDQTGIQLSERNIESIRNQYRTTIHVGGTR